MKEVSDKVQAKLRKITGDRNLIVNVLKECDVLTIIIKGGIYEMGDLLTNMANKVSHDLYTVLSTLHLIDQIPVDRRTEAEDIIFNELKSAMSRLNQSLIVSYMMAQHGETAEEEELEEMLKRWLTISTNWSK